MTNFEALKQMPLKEFANMVFDMVRVECSTLEEFENILKREVPEELEQTLKEALREMQCQKEN